MTDSVVDKELDILEAAMVEVGQATFGDRHGYRTGSRNMKKKTIRGLSQILTYFRRNETPIFFVSPTAFNLVGVEKFVNRFYHINYFDSFEGFHPRVFVPTETGPREFRSMEDVCNYLLSHKEVMDRIDRAGAGPAKLLFVMFDEETEELAQEMGAEVALPPAALRTRIDSKIETTRLANDAGIASAPNVLGRADSYEDLMTQADPVGWLRGSRVYWRQLANAYHMLGEHRKELAAVRSFQRKTRNPRGLLQQELRALDWGMDIPPSPLGAPGDASRSQVSGLACAIQQSSGKPNFLLTIRRSVP